MTVNIPSKNTILYLRHTFGMELKEKPKFILRRFTCEISVHFNFVKT